ncbi:MAG: hypothetical protein HY794_09625 [Desulfarculus sp.]|nr:hypothetical protein [Desulfarculus sp.]
MAGAGQGADRPAGGRRPLRGRQALPAPAPQAWRGAKGQKDQPEDFQDF